MQIHEIPRKQVVTVVSLIALVVVVAAYLWFSSAPKPAGGPAKAFFSVDDGKTWFVDDIRKHPPFPHEGKTAVRARLFTTDGGKTTFCGYLERYTPEAKSKLEESDRNAARASGARPPANVELILEGMEVKAPGGGSWVKRSAGTEYARIVLVRGKSPGQTAEEVVP